ncbi:Piso0_004684 [Millerozyma farinosa CBS 7064]|uniref:non-specific serine/threonine protein kinase n=1 Tax=Pichia sorbitophila (strain ATCC MYA-4447 / BCRC 22081 / CBS 7064 / NBRC 10061 / NRRL Y-12695) TaxID=559304 RepID=G8Y9G7_PICSO|nr:Piso0_004684 [Millerozyma farinosa CBS 7064]CCE85112.1 Piso0_004684 [Millerozyma farinosa CBS 7064]
MTEIRNEIYSAGTELVVGTHKVKIIKYISEGGFAHVYTCNMEPNFRGSTVGCLKRVVVPNKLQLNLLRQEVDAMKRLKGNDYIVSYIDSHASRLNQTGSSNQPQQQMYEVLVLMEYCSRNGLIDFMNTRLTHKLTEPEILRIMHNITTGVAMCHHLRPPLIHRDIKIENVLIDSNGTFKLCDFGSAVGYLPVPKTPQERQLLHSDLMQHTTPQYRSPEMIDLSRCFPIDDKSDIWALGCFLYKLCYYTTPFESPNQKSLQDLESSILNCSHSLHFPSDKPGSIFSSRLKNVIKCCLREDPRKRPNAVQLLEEICLMQGIKTIPNVIPYTLRNELMSQPKNLIDEDNVSVHTNKLPNMGISHPSTTNIPVLKHNHKPNDPFASIDKSKLLQHRDNRKEHPTTSYSERPKSWYAYPYSKTSSAVSVNGLDTPRRNYPSDSRSSNSAASLKDYIQRQISETNTEYPSSYYESNESTVDFLKNKEDSNKALENLRQDTGGSLKSSIKNGLRKISTGGSTTGSINGSNTGNGGWSKRSSISSIKQIFTGGKSRKSSSPDGETKSVSEPLKSDDQKYAKGSIQSAMSKLFDNQNEQPIHKTAHGYGKYTDTSIQDDLSSINSKEPYMNKSKSHVSHITSKQIPKKSRPMPPKIPQGISSARTVPSIDSEPKKQHKPSKGPPPKPKKPIYLKSHNNKDDQQRRLSDSSSLSLPDLDDLEKQFSKRFPSCV